MIKLLSSLYALQTKLQNFHWNVEGDDFKLYHDWFGELYDKVSGDVDEVAEFIRTKQIKIGASLKKFEKESEIGEARAEDVSEMVDELYEDFETIIKMTDDLCNECTDMRDNAGVDLFGNMVRRYEKVCWMLRSSKSMK